MKKGIILVMIFCLLAVPGLSYALGLEAAVGFWNQSIDGKTSYKGTDKYDNIYLNEDLGMDDKIRLMGRVRIDMPAVLPNIYVMATHLEFEGSGEKDSLKFGDIDFTTNTPIAGNLTMNHVDLCLFYSIPLLKMATLNRFNIDLGVNLKVADLDVTIQNKETREKDSESYVLPIPMLFGAIQFNPTDKLAIEAEGRGVSLSGNYLYNIIGRIKYKVFSPVFLAGGYRYDSINLDERDLVLKGTVEGAFVETGFAF